MTLSLINPTFPDLTCPFMTFIWKSHSRSFMLWSSFFSDFQGNGIQTDKKDFTKEMKISLYKESLQSSNSFSHSASFSWPRGESSSSWDLSGVRGSSFIGLRVYFQSHIWSFHSFPCFSSVVGSCATSAFRFVVPFYKTQSYYSPGTRRGPLCPPKYMGISGILPQAGCFESIKWSKVAALCGSECFICLLGIFSKFSWGNLYFLLFGHQVQSSGLTALTFFS